MRFILVLLLLLPVEWSAGQTAATGVLPPSAEQPYRQGMAALRKGDLPTAIRKLRLAVKYAPKSPLTHNCLGLAYLENGQADRAVREFRNAIALGPNFTEAYLNMARALARRQDFDAARQFCQHALRQRPDWAEAHYELGLALRALGREREASAAFAKAAELDPRLRPPRD